MQSFETVLNDFIDTVILLNILGCPNYQVIWTASSQPMKTGEKQ